MSFLPRNCLLAIAGSVLFLSADGCALRATTDFGPQSQTSRRSVSAGAEGLPGVPILGGGADVPGARTGGYTPELGGSPFSSDGGAAGSAGGR